MRFIKDDIVEKVQRIEIISKNMIHSWAERKEEPKDLKEKENHSQLWIEESRISKE